MWIECLGFVCRRFDMGDTAATLLEKVRRHRQSMSTLSKHLVIESLYGG